MNITHLRQDRSTNCGQTCIAMMLGISIREAEKLVGEIYADRRREERKKLMYAPEVRNRPHTGSTVPRDAIEAVNRRGFYAERVAHRSEADFKVPALGFIRVGFLKRSGGSLSSSGKVKACGHFMVVKDGMVYDPDGGVWPLSNMPKEWVVTHSVEVLAP